MVALAGCTEDPPTATPATSSASSVPSAPAVTSAPSTTTPSAPGRPGASDRPSTTTGPSATGSGSADFSGIQLVKSGGIAGITETTTIKPDGTWSRGSTKGADRTGKLSPADLAKLTKLADNPQLKTEGARPWPTRITCNDTFTYLLIVDYQMIKYAACPSAGNPPAVTKEIISLVQKVTG
ncbi:hypothetical protein Ato02nite_049720 [Paractinoplanes toevensis]|uniref:Uncharacterized protein n=2 Tax=Paractinoplanes toevensis TaxID=571911 RepID=A0A919TFI6_9ACTN|nr:hypothetical protein Ato02nite_049720 [Actinoplanes toevensis]